MLHGSWILRWGLGIVFAAFCIMQIRDPVLFTTFLPASLHGPNAILLVRANSVLDGLLAITIGLGIFPKLAPLVGAAHVLSIAITMGFNDVSVRDFGLAMACLSLVFIHEAHLDGKQRAVLDRFFGPGGH